MPREEWMQENKEEPFQMTSSEYEAAEESGYSKKDVYKAAFKGSKLVQQPELLVKLQQTRL